MRLGVSGVGGLKYKIRSTPQVPMCSLTSVIRGGVTMRLVSNLPLTLKVLSTVPVSLGKIYNWLTDQIKAPLLSGLAQSPLKLLTESVAQFKLISYCKLLPLSQFKNCKQLCRA
jgi:hypothetical protein